jgi:hypothetical protein
MIRLQEEREKSKKHCHGITHVVETSMDDDDSVTDSASTAKSTQA